MQHSKGLSYHYKALFKGDGGTDAIHKKWGWYGLIHHLAGGDLLRMRQVEKLYIEEALTFLAYEKDLQLEDKVKI